MSKHRGMMPLLLVLLVAGILMMVGGAAAVTVHTAETAASYQQGLRAVYAAESGASWALAFLREKGLSEAKTWNAFDIKTKTFTLLPGDGTECNTVISLELVGEEKDWDKANSAAGTIKATGTDVSGVMRFVQIAFQMEQQEDAWHITVTQADTQLSTS